MELEPYIGRYSGETRLRRLISIAQQQRRTSSNSNNYSNVTLRQRQRALNLAENQMKQDGKVELYRRVFGIFNNSNSEGGRIIDDDLMEGRPPLDVSWMNATETTNRDTRHVLEGRLSSAQSRLHKDAIRTAYLALAEHDLRTGRDMNIIAPIIIDDGNGNSSGGNNTNYNTNSEATATTTTTSKKVSDRVLNPRTTFTSFTNVNASLFRAMDFSTNKIQTAQIGLLILESALNAGNYVSVRDYAERTESTLKSFKSSSTSTTTNNNNNNNNYDEASIVRDISVKVQIAKGIERMVAKDYKTAASVLVPLVLKGSGDTDDNNNNNNNNNMKQHESSHMLYWPRVTSPQDVALYAGLMCLVTSDRSKMMALADDPEALELVPAVKELLIYYSRANYGPCMRAISGIHNTTPSSSSTTTTTLSQPLLPLGGGGTSSVIVDLYLTPNRWDALIQTIRENCVVDYIRPYQRVKFESLSDLFFPSSSSATLEDNNNSTNKNSNLDSVIDTLVDLMDRKLLPSTTRLDCREKILIQKPSLQHPTVQINLMEERIMDDSHAMLVRLACLEHDLVYRDPLAAANSGGGGRRGHKGASRSGRRYRQQQQHRGMTGRGDSSSLEMVSGGAIEDSSSDDDDGDDEVVTYFDTFNEQGRGGGGADYDTHMVDVEATHAPPPPAAMNPEDMY